ncbi:beta-galactosidase [Nakamurella sp. UYEF19]|uniref:beta-galactosidase n=1 Tax=Nakamurella sp. UYEF19 TaxID=1756392 RepID=UPI0033907EC1
MSLETTIRPVPPIPAISADDGGIAVDDGDTHENGGAKPAGGRNADVSAKAAPSERPWPKVAGLAFGGDYNPEQWDESVWPEDIRLMQAAGVNLVSVGIFAWVRLEPRPGVFDFGWLDRILDLLHDGGISVDLGTPTAAPPAWFYRAQPESWVVDADGRRLGPGSRGICCPSSPAYAAASARITTALAERYSAHPAVLMWHVHNEYGAPVSQCHCEQSQIAFREWLLLTYDTLDAINDAWGTNFWGQRYGELDEIRTPAASASVINPAQQLDYQRFCDHQLLSCYLRERDILRTWSADKPVTTNFMATNCPSVNLWGWAPEVDVVSNDHYLTAERTDRHVLLAMDADLTRSLAGGRPWMLMEHSTSAVNWQPRNLAKEPGEMARNSLAHIARGADAALFFQWRGSRSGAEKFHSSMLPHAGTNSEQWTELVDLGRTIKALADVRGTTVTAEVALLWDWESFWAQDLDWHPSVDLDHRERTIAFYTRLWQDNVTVDFAHPTADLSGYKLVIVPQVYLLDQDAADNLDTFVTGGGQLLVSYFSGVVDAHDAVHPQGLSGPVGEVLGISVQEFAPLAQGQHVALDLWGQNASADVWADRLVLTDPATQILGTFTDGPAAGRPALTRRRIGQGSAWYLATRLDPESLALVMDPLYAAAGVTPVAGLPHGLEMVTRRDHSQTFYFLLNHTDQPVDVPLSGTDVISGERHEHSVPVPATQVIVIRQQH